MIKALIIYTQFFSRIVIPKAVDISYLRRGLPFLTLFGLLLEEGIYLAPSQYETNFMSSAHTRADLDQTLAAFERAFQAMKEEANG